MPGAGSYGSIGKAARATSVCQREREETPSRRGKTEEETGSEAPSGASAWGANAARIVSGSQCHLRQEGISLAQVREVIERPEPQPVEVIPRRIFKGWCAQCQQWHEDVLGQGRSGVRLTSVHQEPHQRCWVQDLCASSHVKKNDPHEEAQLLWATPIKAMSEEAVAWAEQGPDPHLSAHKHH